MSRIKRSQTSKLVSTSLFVLTATVGIVVVSHLLASTQTLDTVIDTRSAPPVPKRDTVVGKNYTHTLRISDENREYVVHIPKGYTASKTHAVLLAFHGGFGNAEQFEDSSGLSKIADERGFIVIYGQGLSFGPLQAPVWNAGACCGQAQESQRDIDDVSYVRAVVTDVQKRYSVDKTRIYSAGMSNGGMLTQRLSCEAADILAGAASVAGTIAISDCNPVRPIPMLIIHGTEDKNVPYEGGRGSEAFNRAAYISIEQEFYDWGQRNHCNTDNPVTTQIAPRSRDGKSVEKKTYTGCVAPVELYTILGGGHEWPGGQKPADNRLEQTQPTQVLDASEVIVNFFGL